jgi:hypothetical protein
MVSICAGEALIIFQEEDMMKLLTMLIPKVMRKSWLDSTVRLGVKHLQQVIKS